MNSVLECQDFFVFFVCFFALPLLLSLSTSSFTHLLLWLQVGECRGGPGAAWWLPGGGGSAIWQLG